MLNISNSLEFGFDIATSITIIATAITWLYTKRKEEKESIERNIDEKSRSNALMTINDSIKELEPFYEECVAASTCLSQSIDNIIDKPVVEMSSSEIQLLINTLHEMVKQEQTLQVFQTKLTYRLFYIRPILLAMPDSREILTSLEQSVNSKNLDGYTSRVQPLIELTEIIKAHIEESNGGLAFTDCDAKSRASLALKLTDEQKVLAYSQFKEDLIEQYNLLFNYCNDSLLCLSAVSGKMLSKDCRSLDEWKRQIYCPDGGLWAVEDFTEMFNKADETNKTWLLRNTFKFPIKLYGLSVICSLPYIAYKFHSRAQDLNISFGEYLNKIDFSFSRLIFTLGSYYLILVFGLLMLIFILRKFVMHFKKSKIRQWLSKRSDSEIDVIYKSYQASGECNSRLFRSIFKGLR